MTLMIEILNKIQDPSFTILLHILRKLNIIFTRCSTTFEHVFVDHWFSNCSYNKTFGTFELMVFVMFVTFSLRKITNVKV